jgi:hypothetical protein
MGLFFAEPAVGYRLLAVFVLCLPVLCRLFLCPLPSVSCPLVCCPLSADASAFSASLREILPKFPSPQLLAPRTSAPKPLHAFSFNIRKDSLQTDKLSSYTMNRCIYNKGGGGMIRSLTTGGSLP